MPQLNSNNDNVLAFDEGANRANMCENMCSFFRPSAALIKPHIKAKLHFVSYPVLKVLNICKVYNFQDTYVVLNLL